MNIKTAVIFDLDGTILNTLEDLHDSVNYALRKFNYPTRTLDEVRSFVGNGIKLLIKQAVSSDLSEVDENLVFNAFVDHYSANLAAKTKPYEGIIDLLSELKKNNVVLGIVSNKFQEGVTELNEKFFKDYIKVVVGTREGIPRKPNRAMVDIALNELGISRDDYKIYYVGDSDVDIMTARLSDLPVISVTWGFRTESELKSLSPDYIVNDPKEIVSIVIK